MKISIADRHSDAIALGKLFSRNLADNYISHSELQGYRAIRPGEWAMDLEGKLRAEIQARLAEPMRHFPSEVFWEGAIEAQDENGLVGMALVTLSRNANVPFGVIEDIVIDLIYRKEGRGEMMIRWIIDNFRRAGINRVFLESGITNEGAHRLFERIGFSTVSIGWMCDL